MPCSPTTGWQARSPWRTASSGGSADVTFPVANLAAHKLPGLVMGHITGRRTGSGSYELDLSQLSAAVELLAPAEAATMMPHPNIAAWRRMLADLQQRPDGRVLFVFVRSLDDPPTSPYEEALRRQVAESARG